MPNLGTRPYRCYSRDRTEPRIPTRCLKCANGRAVIASTLQAAWTSAIVSDTSSWLRLPRHSSATAWPPRLGLPRILGRSIRTTAVKRVCRVYFPLIDIVFTQSSFGFGPSEKFACSASGYTFERGHPSVGIPQLRVISPQNKIPSRASEKKPPQNKTQSGTG